MMRLLSLCMLLAAATAFTSPQPWGTSKSVAASSSQRFMFSADDDTKKADVAAAAPALATMDTPVAAAASSAEEEQAKNFVRNMNTGELREVKWVDPAMSANTNPLRMSWWAYIAFGFPFVVLADDAFHFLPEDGPLGFLGRM